MNFVSKFETFKTPSIHEILNLKKTRRVDYGGASSSTIYIHKKYVAKIIASIAKPKNSTIRYNNEEEEIKFYKAFTEKLILTKKTPHIVGCYDVIPFDIDKVMEEMKCTTDLNDHLEKVAKRTRKKKKDPSQKKKTQKQNQPRRPIRLNIGSENPICRYLNEKRICNIWGFNNTGINRKEFYAVILENCYYNIEEAFNKLKKYDYKTIKAFLDRIIFQYAYTMMAIYSEYPNFIHNDMFLRNILGTEVKSRGNQYFKYSCFGKDYYFPVSGIMIKINDFGFSVTKKELGDPTLVKTLNEINQNCDPKVPRKFETDNKSNQDTFNFILELYERKTLWGVLNPLKMALNYNKIKKVRRVDIVQKHIRKCLKKYFDIEKYDLILKNMEKDRKKMSYIPWSPKGIPTLEKLIPRPEEWFKNNVFDEYTKVPSGNFTILEHYQF